MNSLQADLPHRFCLQKPESGACDAVELILEEKLASERGLRKSYEAQCRTLLYELESREEELEQLKHTLMSRVADAEAQMNMLIQLRDEETRHAEKAASKLRDAVRKLQSRHDTEKEELQNTLIAMQDASEKQAQQWRNLVQKGENDQEALTAKLRKSEANANKLSEEITRLKKELEHTNARNVQLQKSNNELSVDLTKAKCSFQKASSRAEAAATQIGELRKQLEQVTLTSAQSEQSMRTANERRIAAESALHAVRQRADTQSLKLSQLEREYATEKTRLEEKCNNSEGEVQKLRRRILAIQNEAAKWKRYYQTERDGCREQMNRAKQLLEDLTHDRAHLEKELKKTCAREADKLELIQQLQKQAMLNATDASSRLIEALSTGKESVATALELKQRIAEQLQPELDKTTRRCQQAEAESRDLRQQNELLQTELTECRDAVKYLESRLSEQQTDVQTELDSLKEQLLKSKEETQLQSTLLRKAEDQAHQYETELVQLKQTHETARLSLEDNISSLRKQLAEVQSAHDLNTERLHTAQRLVVRLKSARDSATSQLNRLEAELKTVREQHETSQRQTMEELATLRSQLQTTQQKLTDAELTNKQLTESQNKQAQVIHGEHEQKVISLKQKIAAKSHTVSSLENQIVALREDLLTAQKKLQTASDSCLTSEKRLEERQRKIDSLEANILERDEKIHRLVERLAEVNSNLLEQQARSPENGKNQATAIHNSERMSSNTTCEHGAMETRLHEIGQALALVERERNEATARTRELELQLLQCKHAQSNHEAESMEFLRQRLEELSTQLGDMQRQRDHVAECLRDTKEVLRQQTSVKQALEERLANVHEQYEQQNDFKSELSASQRERSELKQQLAETNFKLQLAESLAQETQNRLAQVELEQKRVLRESEKLAVDAAAQRAISQFSVLSFPKFAPLDERMDVAQYPESQTDWTPEYLTSESHHKQPQESVQSHNSVSDGKELRKVPSVPILDSTDSVRPASTTVSHLEALIREVTDNLDKELGRTSTNYPMDPN